MHINLLFHLICYSMYFYSFNFFVGCTHQCTHHYGWVHMPLSWHLPSFPGRTIASTVEIINLESSLRPIVQKCEKFLIPKDNIIVDKNRINLKAILLREKLEFYHVILLRIVNVIVVVVVVVLLFFLLFCVVLGVAR